MPYFLSFPLCFDENDLQHCIIFLCTVIIRMAKELKATLVSLGV